MSKRHRLTAGDQRTLDRIREQGRCLKTMSDKHEPGAQYRLPSGDTLLYAACKRLIESGKLELAGDGLFGDSQTFIPSVSEVTA